MEADLALEKKGITRRLKPKRLIPYTHMKRKIRNPSELGKIEPFSIRIPIMVMTVT